MDRNAQAIAQRLNKLHMFAVRGGDWSEGDEDDDDDEASLYVCARRLRNKVVCRSCTVRCEKCAHVGACVLFYVHACAIGA